ncbi:MAG: phosphopentomutase [Candidatus Enteromonas sp.]|jgi:phosphopentomutase|nr:phosphopentomutase [Bacilli bacterium]MEE3299571.1 phosphopentomutase [Candidatus Enteromonas sp.]MEE3401929.1 phosphopentomutase [Candidatus Enteromonas sp.]MEE3431480.1 phosphopentomutase [Candidatus Enteromonas sp.]MEE3442403.1 phosphopentomutase [Candidatus Enteromonas sp.]
MAKHYKRFFVIVADSAGVGEEPDAAKFGDVGSNTWAHAAESVGGLKVPFMEAMGIGELDDILGVKAIKDHKNAYSLRLRETSNGKDTMTGHWEMMGVNTQKPFQTFTDTGFPQELIDELEERTGHKIIGNYSASGTAILVELGEQQMKENSLIVYTSADSVLQIAAHEEVTGLDELYRCCEIAREICMRPEYLVGRVIARPYVGTNKNDFKRVGAHRHDYTVSPTGVTALDILKEKGLMVSAVGKIYDIFNGVGITKTIHTATNEEGMDEAIRQAKEEDWEGICFVNLVEFDSEFGHRRNAPGYAHCLEALDKRVGEFIKAMREDDVLMITADHGNDPTFHGTDHTREKVPLLIYSPSFENGRNLDERASFADIGSTILANFGLEKKPEMLGESIQEIFE